MCTVLICFISHVHANFGAVPSKYILLTYKHARLIVSSVVLGQHDQENMEAILVVGPILKAIKPRMGTMEQAPGLLTIRKHRLWFRLLINE